MDQNMDFIKFAENAMIRVLLATIKEYLHTQLTDNKNITLYDFIDSKIDAFVVWLCDKYKVHKLIKYNSMGISPDVIKDHVLFACVSYSKLLGKFAMSFVHNNKEITLLEFLDEDTIKTFIKYMQNVKSMMCDMVVVAASSPELIKVVSNAMFNTDPYLSIDDNNNNINNKNDVPQQTTDNKPHILPNPTDDEIRDIFIRNGIQAPNEKTRGIEIGPHPAIDG